VEEAAHSFTARSDSPTMPYRKTARKGDKGKAVGSARRRLCCLSSEAPSSSFDLWIKEADCGGQGP
jgi:hypothetical protein